MQDLLQTLENRNEIELGSEIDVKAPANWGNNFFYNGSNYEIFVVEEEDKNPEIRIYPVRGLACLASKVKEKVQSVEDLLRLIDKADNVTMYVVE